MGGSASSPMEESKPNAWEIVSDVLSKRGQSAQETENSPEVTSPQKPKKSTQAYEVNTEQKTGQGIMKIQNGKGRIKKLARVQGLAQGKDVKAQSPIIGLKRQGSLIFSEGEESAAKKEKCEDLVGSYNEEVISAVVTMQRRREP